MPTPFTLYSQPTAPPSGVGLGQGAFYPYRVPAGTSTTITAPPAKERQAVYCQWGQDAANPNTAFDVAIAAAETDARTIMFSSGTGLTAEEINAGAWARVISTHFTSDAVNGFTCMVVYCVSFNDIQGNDNIGKCETLF